MTNAVLIKALRTMDISESCPCEYQSLCKDKECIVDQAADALEEAEQRIADLETALAACRVRSGLVLR